MLRPPVVRTLAATLLPLVSEPQGRPPLRFEEVAFPSFRHETGAEGEYFLPETMGSGLALFDADGDGDLDVYLVNGGRFVDGRPSPAPSHLYRNDGGLFTEVGETAGVVSPGYGMGCVAGDADDDGDQDLYVANFGPDVLFRNDGTGRFADVSERARVATPGWSVSACLFDADRDGDSDLFVVRYLDATLGNNRPCKTGTVRDYCSPRVFDGMPAVLYRNLGDGTFEDATEGCGLLTPPPLPHASKGLGVLACDLDRDGDPDLYVANDSTPNYLWRNRGDGRFAEEGLLAGVACSAEGISQAGMGVDAADADGDGDFDLFVTNLDLETNAFYRNDGLFFEEVSATAGLGAPSLGKVGFGTAFADLDDDGDPDLLVANGHILLHVEEATGRIRRAQAAQVFVNEGRGRFREGELGPPRIARGAAVGDVDLDGDLDAVLSENGGGAALLRNARDPKASSLTLLLVGTRSNRDGVGALVTLRAGDLVSIGEVREGSSYASSNDRRLHFGLGSRKDADSVEVLWPSGRVDRVGSLSAGAVHVIVEGAGAISSVPYRR